MFFSHKKLLEWNPSGGQRPSGGDSLWSYLNTMWFNPFLAIATFITLMVFYPYAIIIAGPILLLWLVGPAVAWLISQPKLMAKSELTPDQVTFLRNISRKTWAFFEQFMGTENNWLPPDNFQLNPEGKVAHRTSPTNIGLALLANLSAYDFGFITMGALVSRTANTVKTMGLLERYRGHLYNWYDTISLQPLNPKYISTVDSGNMEGHILVARQGLLTLKDERTDPAKLIAGLRDTLNIIDRAIPGNHEVDKLRNAVGNFSQTPAISPELLKSFIEGLLKDNEKIENDRSFNRSQDADWWLAALTRGCKEILAELACLFPWLSLTPPAEGYPLPNAASGFLTLTEIAALPSGLVQKKNTAIDSGSSLEYTKWYDLFKSNVLLAAQNASRRISEIDEICVKFLEFSNAEYEFLYDKSKHLLTIGYNVDDHRKDSGYYDLLASEASLCSFVAIAKGKLPQENWFALGRLLTDAGGASSLISWSGSMFEYLMPLLVMPLYEQTLLDQTFKAAVARQIKYGAEHNVPWGVSESGYNMVDTSLNYQYKAFGVPGMGLKRGLGEDLVIAPYATALALMVMPGEACRNLQRLSDEGFEGNFGFYEAIDYTASRLPRGQSSATIQSFMAHHQGMSLLSFAYVLQDKPMQKRFESELEFRATMLLLQERIPKTSAYYSHTTDIATVQTVASDPNIRLINTPKTPTPEVQLLSNGRYHVMITNAGGGYSRWKDISVTRWREDSTRDNWGAFCYIRNVEDGEYWSNTYQPTLKQPKNYEVSFTQGRAEFRRRDFSIETYTEIVISPEDDIEMRRVHITNHSRKQKIIEITTYAEVVLASSAADTAHPAFSNLFVQTEIIENKHAILCNRRPRSLEEHPPWMFHLATLHGATAVNTSYETDRSRFIGRGHSLADPAAMQSQMPLSGNSGSVLDPIVAVRYQVTLEAEQTIVLDMILGMGETKENCLGLIEKYQDKHHKDRVFELAWTHSQVVLRQLNATEGEAQLYGQLAGSVIFANPALRADPSVILKNHRGQSGLWGHSISGDLPIVLLRIEDEANIELVKQLVQAHGYWRLKGLVTDLVIWNEDHGGYRQNLQNQIIGLVTAGTNSDVANHPGGIYVRSADQISNEDRILFQTVARINISDTQGTLDDHVNRFIHPKNATPLFVATQSQSRLPTSVQLPPDMVFFNGSGGFAANGKEYIIKLAAGKFTPAPWVNVLANPNFGCVISESGQSYTWIENAHQLRLTPWENDPVCDKGGEAFYLRDEETGYFWSPVALPVTDDSPYITRHGFGYSIFEHSNDGIDSEMKVYVDADEPVKFFVLTLKNNSGRSRRLSATGYAEWVLGDLVPKNAMYIVSETDSNSNALFARNVYNTEFGDRVAFFDTDDANRTFTADRAEFIGRNGSLRRPDAMLRSRLSGKVGASLDPCAAMQSVFVLLPAQERKVVFRLGVGKNMEDARNIVQRMRGAVHASDAFVKVQNHWKRTLNSLQIETPDTAVNILANGWLLYQTISSRLWARSGYYQSGGAFGFRDQLQDVLAVIYVQPAICRKQLLLCASRQFVEGDVQHWWHPPEGRGVRTRCSDDMLWLPFVTAQYVLKNGDTGILDENVPFLEGRLLNAGEESNYDLPLRSDQSASLYVHCVKAIEHSLKFGAHGLPLIGSGDWNDGMDKVGEKGKGESIWLGFFLYDVLVKFAVIADNHSDTVFGEKCRKEAAKLQNNLEENGWDGSWYRRAYFDDGAPLGSSSNDECQIDSISQSWSVLSGAAVPERSRLAVAAADKRLVRPDSMLIQLLDPPFDKSAMNPGYIKGYVPGIRENGGQYTHAAIWMIMAFAKIGNAKRAWELLSMINPLNHTMDESAVATYKTEPYVAAADVYSVAQNKGRGGWTWYTGSAGWMYQLIIESLLGLRLEGNKLRFKPCIPSDWPLFKIRYCYRDTAYLIKVSQVNKENGKSTVIVDGSLQEDCSVTLVDDRVEHNVEVILAVFQTTE